jgi:phage/plasmid-associated DNA primase
MNPEIDIKAIIQEFGVPAYANDKGKLTRLNDNFWAAYYAGYREKIIYEPCEREFYDFESTSGIFTPKSSDAIRTELSALVFEGANNWDGWYGMNVFRNAENLAGTITHLRGHVEERDFFNHPSHFVHLGNCTLRFEPDGSKFSVEPFSPEHRSRNRSPINYEPKATCPEFEKTILGHVNEDDRLLMQKYAGQCLLGRNLTQRFVILDGVGGASKGSFVLVLNGIVGPKNIYELRPQMLDQRFEVGRMIGRTLLVGSDVKGNFLNGPGGYRIKSFVGGDPLEAETKCSNQRFTVYGTFNLLITSNARLCIYLDGDQSAWERRLIIIRYDKPYVGRRIFEIDKQLLRTEASGILNWCIKGLALLFQDYAQAGDIILTADQKSRVSDLLSESDSLRLFVTNQIVRDDTPMGNGESHSLATEDIVAEYIEDCIKVKQWTPVAAATAEKRLPDIMLRGFGTAKSNSLKRNGKPKRGFWYVRWR